MFRFEVNNKEYKIKFAYKPTVKTRLISKLANAEGSASEDNMESLENMLTIIPEMILVGLQCFHSDEFGFDYNTNDGYQEQLDKVFDLVDEYLSGEDADFQALYSGLENELTEDGFLASLFRNEKKKAEQKTKRTATKKLEN